MVLLLGVALIRVGIGGTGVKGLFSKHNRLFEVIPLVTKFTMWYARDVHFRLKSSREKNPHDSEEHLLGKQHVRSGKG